METVVMDYVSDKYKHLCNYLQKDTVGSQLTIYGVASGMLVLAFVKRRPAYVVREFKKPSHLPDRLIYNRRAGTPLTGTVRDIQPQDQETMLVVIGQRPWLPLLMSGRQRTLSLKLPGVRVNSNGYAWLQNCLIGREVTFIPLQKKSTSQLCLLHPKKDKDQLLDISETLLKLRFAKFTGDATTNGNYYKYLRRVESSTNKRESWIAWAAQYPWLWKKWHELLTACLPKPYLLPPLVR